MCSSYMVIMLVRNVVPLTMQGEPVTGQLDLYATAAVDKHSDELIIKVANTGIVTSGLS